MPPHLLAQNVHLCLLDGNAIFLDVERDKYVGLDASHTDILRRVLNQDESAADCESLIAQLIGQKLLTQDPRQGRPLRATEATRPARALFGYDYDPPCEVHAGHLFAFLLAYVQVIAWLRLGSLASAIRTVCPSQCKRARKRQVVDAELVHRLVLVFRRIRPLFYRARDNCLLDSLVLVAFLAKYSVFPHVVLAVAIGPFAAHCWVQHADLVLNDRLERVTKYTPIMTA